MHIHGANRQIKSATRLLLFVFILIVGLGVAKTVWGEDRSPAAAGPWYQRYLVGMEVGPTGAQFGNSDPTDNRFAAKFDGREIVEQCKRANCDYVVLWARDGDYAYYNSKLCRKAPGLGTRDPLREAVDKAHQLGMPLIAYCVVQQNGHFLHEHPEFEMRDAQQHGISRFCLNSGYLTAMKKIVDEQLAYGIDGFHIDMLDQGFGPPYGCWCDTCRKQFEAEYHEPMPTGPTWDAKWDRMLEFRYRSSESFEKELVAHIRAARPHVSVDFNYHGNPPFSWEVGQRPVQHAGNADFVTGETGVWGFSALGVGLNAEFYRAATPGRPFQVAMQRGVRMYHDQTTRPLADIRWELFTLLAHGALVTVVDKTTFEGRLDPVTYERLGEAFAEVRRERAHFGHQPVQEVGIWYDARSRDWLGRENAGEWNQSFLGVHKALVYEHIPWGIVLDENATLDALNRFRVICLPNVGIVSQAHAKLLEEYVRGGGNLVLTGLSGCYDSLGKLQPRSSLESLLGAKFKRRLDSNDNWVRFAEPFGGTRPNWPFLIEGPAGVFEPTTAQSRGELCQPARTKRQQDGKEGTPWPMSADVAVGPAVLINQLGQGRVLTFAGSPDWATAGEHPLVEARKLLRDAIRELAPHPRVRISAPTNVEAVVTDDPRQRKVRVHLLGYNAPPQTMPAKNRPYVLPALIEDPPHYRATVTLTDAVTTAAALHSSTMVRASGHEVTAEIEELAEVLIISY